MPHINEFVEYQKKLLDKFVEYMNEHHPNMVVADLDLMDWDDQFGSFVYLQRTRRINAS